MAGFACFTMLAGHPDYSEVACRWPTWQPYTGATDNNCRRKWCELRIPQRPGGKDAHRSLTHLASLHDFPFSPFPNTPRFGGLPVGTMADSGRWKIDTSVIQLHPEGDGGIVVFSPQFSGVSAVLTRQGLRQVAAPGCTQPRLSAMLSHYPFCKAEEPCLPS